MATKNLNLSFFYLLLFSIVFAFPANTLAQNKVDKANKLYKAKNYGSAIPLYEQLFEEEESSATIAKLATCYRMTNQTEKAEGMYARMMDSKKVKPKTYVYYVESLISNGKYAAAEGVLQNAQQIDPDNEDFPRLLNICKNVKDIYPIFDISNLRPYEFNSDLDDNSPVFFKDELVFSSDRSQGVKLLKQKSGWTGRDYIAVYSSTATGVHDYSEPSTFSSKINELNKNTAGAAFWQDEDTGLIEVYFTKNSSHASKTNEFNMQLFRAESTNGGKGWRNIELMEFCNNGSNYMHPAIAPNGKTLYFVSDKGKGQGGTDIYSAKRKSDGTWYRPENMGSTINSTAHDGFPFMSKDDKFFFCSKGHAGYGGFDIFMSKKDRKGKWEKPINIGRPMNSPADDISIVLSEDNKKGAFTSSREGGDDDIFLFDLNSIGVQPMNVNNESKTGFPVMIEEKEEVVAAAIDIEEVATPTEEKSEVKEAILKKSEVSKDDVKTAEITETVEEEKEVVKEEVKTTPQKENELIEVATEIEEVDIEKEEITEEKTMVSSKNTTEAVSVIPTKEVVKKEVINFSDLPAHIETDQLFKDLKIIMNTIQYEKQGTEISDAMALELNHIVQLLKNNPSMKIELACHTESIGGSDSNLSLSTERSNAAVDYIVQQGILATQLVGKGYGESQLLNGCDGSIPCVQDQHSENRRMEIKILSLD